MNLKQLLIEIALDGILYEKRSNVIYAIYNEKDIGFIKIIPAKENNVYLIDYVKVNESYRGYGLYKTLIKKVFELVNPDYLISEDRVSFTNNLYKKWMSVGELDRYDKVKVSLNRGELSFEKVK